MKKKIIITFIILIIIWALGLGGYIVYQKYKQQDPFELEWVRTYYNYLKENDAEMKQENLKYYRKNEKIQFCKIENIENPVMLYNYEELGECFTIVFYLDENNNVSKLENLKKDFKVEYLYNVEEDKYDYYIHETRSNDEYYSKLSENIKISEVNKKQEETTDEVNWINFKKDEIYSVTSLQGEVIEISKLEQYFINTNVIEENWKDINLNSYEDWIKEEFAKAVKKMKVELSNKEKENIEQKENEIDLKKEKIIKAEKEIEEKKKEEEERRRAEEEAKRKEEEERKKAEEEAKKEEEKKRAEESRRNEEEQTNQENTSNSPNYSLSYGTYKGIDYWSDEDPLSKYETTIVLKEDWTYTQTNFITIGEMTETYSGTFKIVEDANLGRIILLSEDDNYYKITGNNQLTSKTGSIITYEGN